MANKDEWRQRVGAWRKSGQRAEDFSAGRGFSAGLLRHWAWRLGLTRRRGQVVDRAGREAIRLARVVPAVVAAPAESGVASIRIEIGRARVEVPAGFDAPTLAAVVRVLGALSDATGSAR